MIQLKHAAKHAAGALLALACAASAFAVPVRYEGSLASGATVNGSVGGFGWGGEVAGQVDFWSFSAQAGDLLNLSARRSAPGLDPALTLYFGMTSADESLFLNDADWGGLRYLTFADDEITVPGGPGGDPALTGFRLPFAGTYTVAIGGFQSLTAGPYNYSMTSAAAPIPEPTVTLMLLAGLGSMAFLRRRRNAR
jgi:hypothetical protein